MKHPVSFVRYFAVVLLLLAPGCISGLFSDDDGVEPADYLTADYEKWLIEIDYVAGHQPSQSNLDLLRERLESVVHKPGGIEIRLHQGFAGQETWTLDDLRDAHSERADHSTGGDTVYTHVLFVDGDYAGNQGNSKVLGIASGFDEVTIFKQTIDETCSVLTLCTTTPNQITGAVLVHEFGHILGLVGREDGSGDVPVPDRSGREDDDHPGHSSNRDSVMYWAVETSQILNLVQGGIPTDFDAADRADLCAAGGKCS